MQVSPPAELQTTLHDEVAEPCSLAEAAGTSELQEATQEAVEGVTAAAQAALERAAFTARRLQRQQTRARYASWRQFLQGRAWRERGGTHCRAMCREQSTYKFAAILASTGVTAMAISAVYFRFTWHMRDGAEFPTLEAAATLLLTFGGVVRAALLRGQ